jgi:hypothetical protein
MFTRRFLLGSIAVSFLATAPVTVGATTTDVEGAAYGGTSAGGWACGPRARANYAGVGGRVRVSEDAAPLGGKGYTGEVAAAGEYEATRITDCDPQKTGDCTAPPSVIAGGAHARVGHRWTLITLEGGATVYTAWDKNTDTKQSATVFPDAEVGVNTGPARAVLGIGTPTVTTLRRPGAYFGYDIELTSVGIESRLGVFRGGPALDGDAVFRADVAALIPVSPAVKLRLGGSGGTGDHGASGEATAGIRGTL